MERRAFAILAAAALLGGGKLPGQVTFIRGDVTGTRGVQIDDAVGILLHLFGRGEPLACLDAADADDDGRAVVSDAIFVINSIIRGGPVPPAPFPFCGEDPTEDALDCRGSSCVPRFTIAGRELSGDPVIFVVDRSGSMQDGGELQWAKVIVMAALAELPAGTEFAVIFFDAGRLQTFPPGRVPARATSGTQGAAVAWVGGMTGGSGSCVQMGLEAALEFAAAARGARPVIVYLGDGGGTCHGQNEEVYLEQTLEAVTRENAGRARIYTFGMGVTGDFPYRLGFITELAARNGGEYTPLD